MGGLNKKLADSDAYVINQQLLTANNPQGELNVSIGETYGVRATSVAQQQGLTGTLANVNPNTTLVGQQIIGEAVGGVIPCFAFHTPITQEHQMKPIGEILVGKDLVRAFNNSGNVINALVVGKWEHLVDEFLRVTFADGRVTDTIAQHRYWVQREIYREIFLLDSVRHWNKEWTEIEIVNKEIIKESILMYNLTVDIYHNYLANGDGVSNLKPAGEPE